MEDERFKHVLSDPKFRRIPKGERKVKIDKRFRSMFKSKNFKVKYTVDKRGRPVKHNSSEDLKRYYELSSEGDSSISEDEEAGPGKFVRAPKDDEELSEIDPGDKAVTDVVKSKLRDLKVDYARGEGRLYSESSSDDDESEEEHESDSESIDHKWGELDGDAEKTDEATRRLAACNMDWDRIRALDLMVLFHSFLAPGGCIESIAIYPSEFGKQRMKEEEIKGPIELVETKVKDGEEGDENEEGSKYHMEKLRQYQLNRLKYYYAVITCDSVGTANKIYTECDGMEYESSATKIDLRFIPDDMAFDDDPREVCEKLPELNKYQPRFFTTTALQQAKVNLTWDETNPERVELHQKLSSGKVDDVTDADLEAYLALSSDEEEEEGKQSSEEEKEETDDPIEKYKALLQGIENEEERKKNRDVEMEVTWGIDLERKTEELVKKKISEKGEKTPFQVYLEKRKQKRKERKKSKLNEQEDEEDSDVDMNDPYFAEEFDKTEFKKKKNNKAEQQLDESSQDAELELLLMNEDDGKKHFSLKKIQEQESEGKSKKKRKTTETPESNFEVNVGDARFSALYTSHHFNIDPTDPHYKKTKGMEAIVQEKLKRREAVQEEAVAAKEGGKKKDTELSVLVKSVKRKASAFSSNKK